jgi:hypothetical protein
MKYTFKVDKSTITESISVGDAVLVYSTKKEGSDNERYRISKLLAQEGLGGNMDSSIKRFHGWRGTSFGNSTTSYGVYKIQKIIDLNEDYFRITIDKEDIKKDLP